MDYLVSLSRRDMDLLCHALALASRNQILSAEAEEWERMERELRERMERELRDGFPLRQRARDRRRREVNEYHRAERAIRSRKRKTEAS
jgi:hypothetical protein